MTDRASPMSYVYDGKQCVGFIIARGKHGVEAFDRAESSLGFFKTLGRPQTPSSTVCRRSKAQHERRPQSGRPPSEARPPVDRERPCCRNICVIGPANEIDCADCGQRRGRFTSTTASWIETVVARFGAPTTPIVVRKSYTFQEEALGTEP